MLIGVTDFFRDPQVFAYLDDVVLPKLSAGGRPLRVWSAGSPTVRSCTRWRFSWRVVGFSMEAPFSAPTAAKREFARPNGVGSIARKSSHLPVPLRETFFAAEAGGWRVCNRLRQAVCWKQGNILSDQPTDAASWDLILCRNVAIYLEPAASALLWSRLLRALRVGGVLVVGTAERPASSGSPVRLSPCVFEKKV